MELRDLVVAIGFAHQEVDAFVCAIDIAGDVAIRFAERATHPDGGKGGGIRVEELPEAVKPWCCKDFLVIVTTHLVYHDASGAILEVVKSLRQFCRIFFWSGFLVEAFPETGKRTALAPVGNVLLGGQHDIGVSEIPAGAFVAAEPRKIKRTADDGNDGGCVHDFAVRGGCGHCDEGFTIFPWDPRYDGFGFASCGNGDFRDAEDRTIA